MMIAREEADGKHKTKPDRTLKKKKKKRDHDTLVY